MDSNLIKFLQLLAKGNVVKITDLITQHKLTARQIRYRVTKINDFLLDNGLPIVALKKGTYSLLLNKQQKKQLEELVSNFNFYDYKMNSDERQEAIALLLIATDEYVTSSSLADQLDISKRTTDSDIVKLRERLIPLDLKLDAKSSKGYRILGNERDIRNLCVNLLTRNIELKNDKYTSILPIGKIIHGSYCNAYLEDILNIIHFVESEISKELTYESKLLLSMYLVTMLKRTSMGNIIEKYPKTFDKQPQSRNYAIALNIASQIEEELSILIPNIEVYMITMFLEGIQYIVPERYLKTDWMEMQIVIDEIIQEMSNKMNVDFTNDKELYFSLQAHLGHTIFKVKHKLDIVNPDLREIKRKYFVCFNDLKEIIKENQSPLLKGIKDDEIGYLVLHFCSSLERKMRMLPPAKVAIVCINGAAAAQLLRESILTRFSNIAILAVVTKFDLQILKKMNLDFVISSIDIGKNDIPYVVVNPLLTEKDYIEINKMLIKYYKLETIKDDSYYINSKCITNDLIENENQTKEKLELMYSHQEKHQRLKLHQLLTPKYISFKNKAKTWREAVKISCVPLLENGDVSEIFLDSVIQSIQEVGPYVVFSKGVALVHSDIGYGVKRMAVSLTRFEDGVAFNHDQFDPVKVIFCLAPIDYSSHVQALQGLLNLLNEYTIEELCKIDNSNELFERLEREKW